MKLVKNRVCLLIFAIFGISSSWYFNSGRIGRDDGSRHSANHRRRLEDDLLLRQCHDGRRSDDVSSVGDAKQRRR